MYAGSSNWVDLRLVVTILLFAMTSLAFAGWARADDRQDLEKAVSRFKAGKYEEAAPLFEALLQLPVPPDAPEDHPRRVVFREARPVYAATLVFKGLPADLSRADEVILEHYMDDPFYEQVPGSFHENVEERFREVRGKNRAAIEAKKTEILGGRRDRLEELARFNLAHDQWVRDLTVRAGEMVVTEDRSRWVAMVPFGVGQFYNGSTGLGVVFAVAEALAISTSVISFAVATSAADTNPASSSLDDLLAAQAQFENARTVNWVSVGAAGTLVVAGIIEAQASFQGSETRIVPRTIPPEPKLDPSLSVTETGAVTVGVQVTF